MVVAGRYFESILSDPTQQTQSCQAPIATSLRSLQQTLWLALPLLRLITVAKHPSPSFLDAATSNSTYYLVDSTASSNLDLQQLFQLVFMDDDITDVIWTSWRLQDTVGSEEIISRLQMQLRVWKKRNCQFLPPTELESTEANNSSFNWAEFAIPPRHVPSTSPKAYFAAAVYYFAMGRTMWAKSQLSIDAQEYERSAYLYFYETMRCAATISSIHGLLSEQEDKCFPCETLHVGLLPALHIIGQCSPTPLWLRWVAQHMKHIGQEGVFNGSSLATSLEVFHTFEMHNQSHLPTVPVRYRHPASRVVSVLVPEVDGRHYTSYYAVARHKFTRKNDSVRLSYCPLGHARWSIPHVNEEAGPHIAVYASMETAMVSLASDWLRMQAPVREWLDWGNTVDLSINRILRDHIRGSQLVPDSWA